MAGQLTRKDAASRRQSGRLDAQLEALKGQLATAEATLAGLPRRSEAGRAEMLGAEEATLRAWTASWWPPRWHAPARRRCWPG